MRIIFYHIMNHKATKRSGEVSAYNIRTLNSLLTEDYCNIWAVTSKATQTLVPNFTHEHSVIITSCHVMNVSCGHRILTSNCCGLTVWCTTCWGVPCVECWRGVSVTPSWGLWKKNHYEHDEDLLIISAAEKPIWWNFNFRRFISSLIQCKTW